MVDDHSQEASIAVDAEGNEEAAAPKKVFNEELHEKVIVALEKALATEDASVPFQGDLENATYLTILTTLRNFNSENYPDPPVDGEAAAAE